jgi:glucosyl-3-phosphoglycerate synthase
MEKPFIPSWNRVISAIPNILEEFAQAVHSDYEKYNHPV